MPRATSILINRPSESARTLATALNVKRVRPERLAYLRPQLLINWGVSASACILDLNARLRHTWLNDPVKIRSAINKTSALICMRDNGISVPSFSVSVEGVNWDGITLARTNLAGSGGDGIVVVREGEELPDAPLYVQYIKKQAEYRVHVVRGEAIAVQQKRKQEGFEQTRDSALIRNHANGWVFCVNNVEFVTDEVKEQVTREAINAVRALGLDFGAVDVIVSKDNPKAYVLEINSAPGLSSPTVISAYQGAFTRIISEYSSGTTS